MPLKVKAIKNSFKKKKKPHRCCLLMQMLSLCFFPTAALCPCPSLCSPVCSPSSRLTLCRATLSQMTSSQTPPLTSALTSSLNASSAPQTDRESSCSSSNGNSTTSPFLSLSECQWWGNVCVMVNVTSCSRLKLSNLHVQTTERMMKRLVSGL